MQIQWLGHSCFRIESNGSSLVLDPYINRMVPGLSPLHAEADAVYCSHAHNDHAARDRVKLSGKACGLQVEALDCFHDEQQGALRGTNKIHIISDGVLRIAHMGDLGHIPDEAILEKLTGLDALLIPTGGYYTIDAATANEICNILNPRVVIPMHYRLGKMGFDVLQTLDEFTALRSDVREYDSDTIILDDKTPRQTAVLRYKRKLF